MIHTVKGFSVVCEAEIDVFFLLEFLCFFYDSIYIGNFTFGFSAFSKSSLYIWKFSVHILLKPNLKDFEHHLTSMWNERNYMLVWTFFGIALLWDWNENWPFPVLWPLLSFPDLLTYWVFSSVQSLSRVRLFATLWTAARQASVSITKSRSLLKPMSIESVMPSSHLILCCPLLLLPPTPSVALVNIAFSLLRNIPSLQRIISISVWMHISAWSIVPYLAWKTLQLCYSSGDLFADYPLSKSTKICVPLMLAISESVKEKGILRRRKREGRCEDALWKVFCGPLWIPNMTFQKVVGHHCTSL